MDYNNIGSLTVTNESYYCKMLTIGEPGRKKWGSLCTLFATTFLTQNYSKLKGLF